MHTETMLRDLGVHVWEGKSGQKYRYSVFMFGTKFGPGPANFVLAHELRAGRFSAVYFGQTDDLSEPFSESVALECIKQNRVTHVHVKLTNAGEEIRRAERSDLIEQWNPPCNQTR